MPDVIDLAGSWFAGEHESPHLWRYLTDDRRFLAAVTRGTGTLFRAHVFHRVSGAPQWDGTWWEEMDGASLTESMGSAQQLARAKIQTLLGKSPA